jgi:Met-zincin/Domain of unknown function (DUF5117)
MQSNPRFFRPSLQSLLAALAALGVAGCATTAAAPMTAAPAEASASAPAAAVKPVALAASAAASAAAAAPAPGQPPTFASVIKDAKESKGLIALWQKEEKVWLELKPEDFNKPFFLSPKISQGIGEAGLYGGTMIGRYGRAGRAQLVEFRRVHNLVQLVAINTDYAGGDAKSPSGRAVAAGFSNSLLGTAQVASAPHPERKTVLVEASAFFLGDMLGLGMALQRNYRQGYALEPRNTYFASIRALPEQVVFNVNAHFYTGSIAVPQPGTPPGVPAPTTPATLPDARSLTFGLYYALAKLPDVPMAPRLADPRLGHFSTNVNDFSDDLLRTPRKAYVNRWRLEKKDPAAALSEPVKPITFWIDRTVPVKYRDAISRGILAWNGAFEKIGFKDAIVVKQQPDDADFDTLDVGVASVRWMTNAQPMFGAIGPSQVDPRSGEIIDADIGMESLSSRSLRNLRSQVLNGHDLAPWARLLQASDALRENVTAATSAPHQHGPQCDHADFAAEQLSYAMDVLEARGDLDPSGPEAEQFVVDYLVDVTMHEVGHTLGLRHNFRSSLIYNDRELSDPRFTAANGLAGSVMEYAPINLARPGQAGGTPFQTVLGPYDYWAIEYAYKPMPVGSTAEQEKAELQRIAARSAEPQLAYGTDEDNFLGIDPESLVFDLGPDPMAFAEKRIAIARELLSRQEVRTLKPDADYSVLRRAIGYAVRDAGRAAGILARQIGGVRTLRDFPGSGRDPLLPVGAAQQRQALDVLARGVLAADAFVISPALQRKLAPDYTDRTAAVFDAGDPGATDYSIAGAVFGMQRALLAQLMSDGVASRLLDSEGKADARSGSASAFHLSELYTRLTKEVWSELGKSGDIASARRELQREHVNRLSAMLLRPTSASRADARSLLRVEAQGLLARVTGAAKRPGLSAEARAHLSDSADTLSQALQARMQRAGV